MEKIRNYIKLMRVHHYIKNVLLFAALGCSGQLLNIEKLYSAIWGFLAFCMISSVIYVINDIKEREKDRIHPTKCRRPIASGKISVKSAYILAAILFLSSMLYNYLVFRPLSSILLITYFALNIAYSFELKNKPLIDVTILTSGFLLRVVYGAVITDIAISNWLYLTVFVLAFYFSLGKRRNELKRTEGSGQTREVLKHYSINFLDKNMYMCLGLANTFYALWCMDTATILHYRMNLIFTVPIVLLITMKYSMNIEGDSDGDPVEVLLHDRILLLLCLVYFVMMFFALYC